MFIWEADCFKTDLKNCEPVIYLTECYSHYHAEHDEDVPQRDEDPKVSQAEQKLSDVVT